MLRRAIRFAVSALLVCLAFAQTPLKPDNPQDIISFLNQTILWYRQLTVQQQLATEPSDVLFLSDNRQLADEIVRLSFDFARAQAQFLARTNPAAAAGGASGPGSRYQNLFSLAANADKQVKQTQSELDDLKRQLETATGRKRRTVESAIAETQSELELRQARRDSLRNMITFVSGANVGSVGSGTLQSQIEELGRTVPAATAAPQSPSGQTPAQNTTTVATRPKTESTGILGAATELLALRRKIRTLEQSAQMTDSLTQSARDMLNPIVAQVKELAQQGDQLVNEPDSQDPAVLAQQKQQIDALTAQYKQLSATLLPLGKETILLDLYNRSLQNWRSAVQSDYTAQLKALSLRIGALGLVLVVVLIVSDIWRKATFRYIQDPRRRYQFLLLRRIVVWLVIAIVIAVAFASELGSLATFAGLLTAGVAVALQNVILSVAGYFFLIGKYGVRVGDRVQVAGVTGDVVDIGLVRLHIMEVGGTGAWARPTGRVVVFSNAVVFQANAGLFKQIPGTKFVWHEITLTLAPESNYRDVEQRMMEAVKKVFNEYRDRMESQRKSMERTLSPVSVHALTPASRVRLTQSGLEVVIR
ncbi:MAG TPA: mechanosensitive ion channel domain-containing protein, partial [Terriglobales bacterium]|nr:mechanosensitive ion channel domain-containing protein [Terriglobales bacterium]